MQPRLVAMTGPLEGRTIPLEDEVLTLGRQASCDLQLREITVSRQHCRLSRRHSPEGDRFLLQDLGSRHGTFVNGLPVRERELRHRDLVTVGTSTFLFLLREAGEEAVEAPPVRLEEGGPPAETAVVRTLDESLFLKPERLFALLPPEARTARALGALLQLSQALHALAGSRELGELLLEKALEVIPAERAALLLLDRGTGEVAEVLARERRPEREGEPFTVSRTAVERALAEEVGLLSNDVPTALSDAASLQAARVRALLAVPLVALEKPWGVLYLDSRDPAIRFDEEHLELATAVAAIAASALAGVLERERLEAENLRLRESQDSYGMVGESPAMGRIFELIRRVAPTDSTVLVTGESGTGKELVARAIHDASPRARRPFVAINCATLGESLLESELFGHEKGAFTGATQMKPGKLEVADSGTLFLDEVGELPPGLQAKLLRVLQERELERVGGTRPIRVDVRLVAATNRDLAAAIRKGRFREDLYYRLNVITLTLPPLRERRRDVPLLARHFAALHGRKVRQRQMGLSEAAQACLLAYDWPGNVRELANAIERAVVLGEGDLIHPEDLPESVVEAAAGAGGSPGAPTAAHYHEALARLKKQLILDAVAAAGGNVTQAAERLGLHPNYLHRLITNLGLRDELER